jgi:hypothetical protein
MLKKIVSLLAKMKQYLPGRHPPVPPPPHPYDPYARKTAPRKRGPYDRSAAVAVAEPDDE